MIVVGELLKLALKEIEVPENEEEDKDKQVDDELRLKQLLWHFIAKVRKYKVMKEKNVNYSITDGDSDVSMNMDDEESNTNNNFSKSENVDQYHTHRVKRHTSGRTSHPYDDIINDSYGEESNDDNDNLMENINQFDEEIAKFDYTSLYDNNNPGQIRCQAPDPISMICGDNRYTREED